MPIKVACQCGQKFAAKDELAGKTVKCPKCASPIVIPAAAAQAAGAQQQQRPPQAAPQPTAQGNDFLLAGTTERQIVGDPFLNDLLAEAGVTSDPHYTGPRCPGCNAPIQADAVLCVKCGYNVRTGQRIKSQVGPSSEFAHLTGGANAEELIAKAEQEILETPIETKESQYETLTAFLLAGGLGFGALILIGLGYLLFRYVDKSATSMTGIATIMWIIGFPMLAIGRIWIIVVAFLEDILQGTLCLLIECYVFYYGFTRMSSVSMPFILFVVGYCMVGAGSTMFAIGDSPEGSQVAPPAIERAVGEREVARLPHIRYNHDLGASGRSARGLASALRALRCASRLNERNA